MNRTKKHNLSGILKKKHEGKWVALTKDYKQIISYSDRLTTLERKVGEKDAVYIKALRTDVSYAFLS